MPTPFAALEARVNAGVFARLANATADFGGGNVVDGIFEDEYIAALGIESSGPRFSCLVSALPAGYRSASPVIRGAAYVVGEANPDGAGMTTLILEKA